MTITFQNIFTKSKKMDIFHDRKVVFEYSLWKQMNWFFKNTDFSMHGSDRLINISGGHLSLQLMYVKRYSKSKYDCRAVKYIWPVKWNSESLFSFVRSQTIYWSRFWRYWNCFAPPIFFVIGIAYLITRSQKLTFTAPRNTRAQF